MIILSFTRRGKMMKINQVNFMCFNLEEMFSFYTEVLEMDLISRTESGFSVLAGITTLVFQQTDSMPFYHFCLRTSTEYFDEIFSKLEQEDKLLKDEGVSKSMFWGGKQAYFKDPDGNILEMVERPYEGEGGAPSGWYDICEIGLPLKDIKNAQQNLTEFIVDTINSKSDTFAFFGNSLGYLVLVKEGRHWFPTTKGATIHPIQIKLTGHKDAYLKLSEYPYYFKVVRSSEKINPEDGFQVPTSL